MNLKSFYEACMHGTLEQVQEMVNWALNPERMAQEHKTRLTRKELSIAEGLDYGVELACKEGHWDIAKFLLHQVGASQPYMLGRAFQLGCQHGHLEMVKDIAQSKKLFGEHFEPGYQSWLGFSIACENGHLEIAKFLLPMIDTRKYKLLHTDTQGKGLNYSNGSMCELFARCCANGEMEIVKYLLNEPDIVQAGLPRPNIHFRDDWPLRSACLYGHFEIVKHLLNTDHRQDEKNRPNIHAKDDFCLRQACERGHLEIVQYLLSSPALQEHANMSADNDFGFRKACAKGHFNVVQYLLEDDSLKVRPSLHALNAYGFRHACRRGHIDIARLIFKHFLAQDTPQEKIHKYLEETFRQVYDHSFKYDSHSECSQKHRAVLEFLILEAQVPFTNEIKMTVNHKYGEIANKFRFREVCQRLFHVRQSIQMKESLEQCLAPKQTAPVRKRKI